MLEFILVLLGLAFPSSDNNTVTSDNPTPQTEITTQSDDGQGGGTSGNSGQNPPTKP